MRVRWLAAWGLAAAIVAPSDLWAAESLRVAVSHTRVSKRAFPKSVMRGIADALTADEVEVVSQRRLARAMRRLGVPRRERARPARLAEAAEHLRAAYVVRVSFAQKKGTWIARTALVRTAAGVIVDTASTRYDDARADARDRGRRIGYGVLAYLASVATPVPPATPAAPSPVAAFDDTLTAGFESEDEEAFFGDDGDTTASLERPTDDAIDLEPDAFDFAGFQWTLRGYASATYRGFFHEELDAGKNRNFGKVGVRPTLTGRTGDHLRVRFLPRIELSVIEPRLHRLMIEEGFVEYATGSYEVRLGFDALSWGAASTVNIADVINARDFSEGYTDAPKIGQPMLSTRFFLDNHSLTVLYMTPFVAPRFAPPTSPFSPFDVAVLDEASYGNIIYGSQLGAWQPQGAVRLALAFHRVDVRASYFYGYRRTPIAHQPTNSLVFPLVHHASIETQVLFGQTSFKIEAASIWHQRTEQTDRPPIRLDNGAMAAPILLPGHRIAWVAGVEHNFDDVAGTALTLVAEFFGDSDSELFTNDIPPDDASRFFSNHVAYGFRWSFNNDVDAKVELSDLMDVTHLTDHLLRLEYAERWFERWTFALGGQLGVAQDGTKMTTFRKLSGVYTELRYNY